MSYNQNNGPARANTSRPQMTGGPARANHTFTNQGPARVGGNRAPQVVIPTQHQAAPNRTASAVNNALATSVNPSQEVMRIDNGMYGQEAQLILKKIYFFAVPATHPMHYRPYEVVGNNRNIIDLVNATQGGSNLDPIAIRGLARDIIRPSMQSQGQIEIAHGWGESRFSFYALIEERTAYRTTLEVVTGYTDEVGYSENQGPNSGVWNERMMLFINGRMVVSTRKVNNGHHVGYQYGIADSSQILRPAHIVRGNGSQRADATIGLRPTDTLTRISAQKMIQGDDTPLFDRRCKIDEPNLAGGSYYGTLSRRSNERSSRYFSTVLNSYRNALGQGETGSEILTMGTAATFATEDNLSKSIFMQRLASDTMYGSGGVITLGELMRMFPNMDSVAEVNLPKHGEIRNDAINTCHMGGSDFGSNVAYAFSHIVPSVLTNCLANQTTFFLTNETRDGRPSAHCVSWFPMFTGLQNESVMRDNFERAIENDVAPEIFNHEGTYTVEMTCQMVGRSMITLTLDGREVGVYPAPNYADGIGSSTLGVEDSQLNGISQTMDHVLAKVFPDPEAYSNLGFQRI